MQEITASEASGNFSDLLDSAEQGETIVVTRSGRRVAVVMPAPHANGAALREVFRRWRDDPALDDALSARIAEARHAVAADLDADPWHG